MFVIQMPQYLIFIFVILADYVEIVNSSKYNNIL